MDPTDPLRRFAAGGAYTSEGDGPPIVLVHGLPGSGRDFRYLAPYLADTHRVIRVDMPGFGESPIGDTGTAPADGGRFLLAMMDALDIERALLVGHSAGSVYIAAAHALCPDRVWGVGLLAAHGLRPHRPLRSKSLQRTAMLMRLPLVPRLFASRLRRGMERVGFRGHSDASYRRTVILAARNAYSEHYDNMRAVTAPCMVAWSSDDAVVEPEISEELDEQMPDGPRLRFDGGGHAIQKNRAAEIAAAIVGWYQNA